MEWHQLINATDEQRDAHKYLKKKDYKALFIIHQCVYPNNFDKEYDIDSSNEAWDILEKSFKGTIKVKEVKLQTHKIMYEFLQMEENESVVDFFTKVTRLVNKIKMYGEVMTSRLIVAKFLRSLLSKFDHMVVSIEESKDMLIMKKEELQGTFESHEQRVDGRFASKTKGDVTLQAQSTKEKKDKGKWNYKKDRWG